MVTTVRLREPWRKIRKLITPAFETPTNYVERFSVELATRRMSFGGVRLLHDGEFDHLACGIVYEHPMEQMNLCAGLVPSGMDHETLVRDYFLPAAAMHVPAFFDLGIAFRYAMSDFVIRHVGDETGIKGLIECDKGEPLKLVTLRRGHDASRIAHLELSGKQNPLVPGDAIAWLEPFH